MCWDKVFSHSLRVCLKVSAAGCSSFPFSHTTPALNVSAPVHFNTVLSGKCLVKGRVLDCAGSACFLPGPAVSFTSSQTVLGERPSPVFFTGGGGARFSDRFTAFGFTAGGGLLQRLFFGKSELIWNLARSVLKSVISS
ncbi:UNVERIFIED_CONTAM: hypothetical protein FKN15_067381 [Acipenser sinensis]